MGQNAQHVRTDRALISIDGVLLTVALLVMLFCTSAFIRITSEPAPVVSGEGLLTLSETDSLLVFEDFNFGANAWAPEARTARVAGVGPVLGPFSDDFVERMFQLPVDTSRVRFGFDLNLHGPWAEDDSLSISLGDRDALTITFDTATQDGAALSIAVENGDVIDVDVRQSVITPRTAEPALPGAEEEPLLRLRIMLQMSPQSDRIALGLAATPSDGASWSLDNLAAVATTDGEV